MQCVNFQSTWITQGTVIFMVNNAWSYKIMLKDPFWVQDRPMDFNEIEYEKSIDMVSKSANF